MMPEAEYSRGINSSNLILTAKGSSGPLEQDSIEMFKHNQIPYFLKMHMIERYGGRQFCYDITGRRSLDQLMDYKALDGQLLFQLLHSLDCACMQAENYMLAENDILLKPEMIFLGGGTEEVLYCYLPGNQEDIRVQFQELMEYLLQRLDHKKEQAVQFAYGVYQRVTEESEPLHTVLKDLSKDADAFQMDSDTNAPPNIPPSDYLAPVPAGKAEKQQAKVKQKETTKKQAGEKLKNLLRKKLYTNNYRDTEEDLAYEEEPEELEDLSVINPTVCMIENENSVQNHFIYQGIDRTRDFHCAEGKMIVGSSSEECDICIPLPMVSRVHARILINEQGTFLEDMNSTNGTQINGNFLKYRERYMLKKGDIVSLAGENYSFH